MKKLILLGTIVLASCNPYGYPFNTVAESGGNTVINGGKKMDFPKMIPHHPLHEGEPVLISDPKKRDFTNSVVTGGSGSTATGTTITGKKQDCQSSTLAANGRTGVFTNVKKQDRQAPIMVENGGNGAVMGSTLKRDHHSTIATLSNLNTTRHG